MGPERLEDKASTKPRVAKALARGAPLQIGGVPKMVGAQLPKPRLQGEPRRCPQGPQRLPLAVFGAHDIGEPPIEGEPIVVAAIRATGVVEESGIGEGRPHQLRLRVGLTAHGDQGSSDVVDRVSAIAPGQQMAGMFEQAGVVGEAQQVGERRLGDHHAGLDRLPSDRSRATIARKASS
jgi:hypothetical protein